MHVETSEGEAKFWLEPNVALARNFRLSAKDLGRAKELILEREKEIRDAWHRHFNR